MTIQKILLAMALGLTLMACAQKGSYVPAEKYNWLTADDI